jgi:hypothetical protein
VRPGTQGGEPVNQTDRHTSPEPSGVPPAIQRSLAVLEAHGLSWERLTSGAIRIFEPATPAEQGSVIPASALSYEAEVIEEIEEIAKAYRRKVSAKTPDRASLGRWDHGPHFDSAGRHIADKSG